MRQRSNVTRRSAKISILRLLRRAAPVLAVLASAGTAVPAAAHHPGDGLDALMGSRETYFQQVDAPAPGFELRNLEGEPVRLADFRDKVVVLFFVYASCPDVCPLHFQRIAEIQGMVNTGAMKRQVEFVSITTDPVRDTPEVLRKFAAGHGVDPANWTMLTTAADQPEDETRRLAREFGHKFSKGEDGYQSHGVVTHLIGRGGRWAANFHGLRFAPVNMVLYVNGLTHETAAR